MSADGLPRLADVISDLGLSAKKALGQNFILDLNLTRKIARLSGPLAGMTVIEIGPGPGGLTRALLQEGAARVVAIERDQRCLPALAQIAGAYPGRLEILHGDALETDMAALCQGAPARIVANLPYNIATLLLIRWLESAPWPPWFQSMTLMFQKEVAERIVSPPGSKVYGRLAVISQWRTEPRIVLTLPPDAFTPPPKVASAVVHLVPRAAPDPPCQVETLGRVTAAAFGQRRKMLRQSLASLTPMPELLLAKAGITPTERAERLTPADFARLALCFDGDLR